MHPRPARKATGYLIRLYHVIGVITTGVRLKTRATLSPIFERNRLLSEADDCETANNIYGNSGVFIFRNDRARAAVLTV